MGNVLCVDCRQTFPPAQVDMSPNGWRCQNCKLRHDIDIHAGADEQVGEIPVHAMRQKAQSFFYRGVGALGGGVVSELLVVSGSLGHGRAATRLFVFGLGLFGWGIFELAAMRRAKKAVQIVEARNRGDAPTL